MTSVDIVETFEKDVADCVQFLQFAEKFEEDRLSFTSILELLSKVRIQDVQVGEVLVSKERGTKGNAVVSCSFVVPPITNLRYSFWVLASRGLKRMITMS